MSSFDRQRLTHVTHLYRCVFVVNMLSIGGIQVCRVWISCVLRSATDRRPSLAL